MIDKLKTIIDGATWFLRSGVAPRVNDPVIKHTYKKINHMTSKKFAMTMTAIVIVAIMYFISILFLFCFPADPHVSALVSMYKDMIFAIATIAGTLVGMQGFVDWRHDSSSAVNMSTKFKEEKIEEYLTGPKEEGYRLD